MNIVTISMGYFFHHKRVLKQFFCQILKIFGYFLDQCSILSFLKQKTYIPQRTQSWKEKRTLGFSLKCTSHSAYVFFSERSKENLKNCFQYVKNWTTLAWMTKKKYVWKKNLFLKKTYFLFLTGGSDGGGTFRLHFWNLHKIWL